MMRYKNENNDGIQELSHDDLDQVSGGFLFLIVLAAVALGGCLADCGHPAVQHP
jgi:bacteriocin-like protein